MKLTIRNVCGLLRVSESTVRRWIGRGILPAHQVNEQYRFNRTDLLEFATSQRINVAADLFDEPDRPAELVPRLAEALLAGGIFHQVAGTDKASVLRAMVERIPIPEEIDRGLLLHLVRARENLQSTGIGDGVALPHVRNPIVQHVPHPLVTLCFLERPVDFDAIDGKPVQALFSLISPTIRTHLQLLSRLSFALHDDGFKRVVAKQGTRESVLAEARRIDDTRARARPEAQR